MLGMVVVLLMGWTIFISLFPDSAGPEVPSSMIPPAVVAPLVQSNMPLRVFPGVGGVLMILPDGSLWQWGKTGPGSWPRAKVPAQVGTNHNWMQALPANNHNVALRTDGTLWEWGWRGASKAGAPVGSSQDPEQMDSGHDWIGIAAGDVHSVALKNDGTLWAWGNNGKFQLGNGPGPNQTNLVQVGTNRDWIAVSAAASYTLALRRDGTLWVWGGVHWFSTNMAGTDFPFPTQVGRETNWVGLDMRWAFLRHQTVELWDPLVSLPGSNAAASSIGYLMASNWISNRSAFGFGARPTLYEVHTDGTLWKASSSSSSGFLTPSNKWHRVGKRSDWVSIWGFGTVLGLTSDGTIWTWGMDPGQEPVPDLHSRITLLHVRIMKRLKKPVTSYSTAGFPPYQKEPRPLMRLAPATNTQSNSERIPGN